VGEAGAERVGGDAGVEMAMGAVEELHALS
jgi:hypothetical protein